MVMQLLEFGGWVAGPEGKLLDLFLWIRPMSRQIPPRIILVYIDDDSFDRCFKSSPLDPNKLLFIVQTVQQRFQPKVIGVDIITDSLQRAHRDTYKRFPRSQNIVWAAGVQPSGPEERQSIWEWLTGRHLIAVEPTKVLGEDPDDAKFQWALPVYPREEDLRLRRVPRLMLIPPGSFKFSWPTTIAKLYLYGSPTPIEKELKMKARDEKVDVLVAYTQRDLEWHKVSELFTCSENSSGAIEITAQSSNTLDVFERGAKDAIVLIGGTFSSGRDFYETTYGRISGLEMNANAITAEATGATISEVPPIFRFWLDVLVGLLILVIFHHLPSGNLNSLIAWCLGGIGFTLIASACALYFFRFVWLSLVGIAIGMVLHVLIEVWKKHLLILEEESAPQNR